MRAAPDKCDQLQEEMLLDGPKYNISEERTSQYETVMYLTVRAWQKEDEGHFTCLSTNSLGKAERTIQSYSESAQIPRSPPGKRVDF